MGDPAAAPVTVFLLGLSGLMLFVSASAWLKAAKAHEKPTQPPYIPVHAFRRAAEITVVAFIMLGVAVCWLALVALLSI